MVHRVVIPFRYGRSAIVCDSRRRSPYSRVALDLLERTVDRRRRYRRCQSVIAENARIRGQA